MIIWGSFLKEERRNFLRHNTDSVRIWHDFTKEKLAIVVDGTCTRLEKSSINEFQYVSCSMQKLDHLLKLIILCCADGYSIDCYSVLLGLL